MNFDDEDIEIILLYANRRYGYQTLSSGRTILIKEPTPPAKECGESFKKMTERIKKALNEINIREDEYDE